MILRRLDETTLVAAGQVGPRDVPEAAAAGVTAIINNRPDGEEPGQPDGHLIEAAARSAGLDYRHIPVAGPVAPAQIAAMADALDVSGGTALLFCRSGTRSTVLWALARSSRGADGESLLRQAAAAGYDLSAIRPLLPR